MASLAVAASPIPQPAHGGQPVRTEHSQRQPQGETAKSDARSNRIPGATPNVPLYVKAACEHGCGYAEGQEGFWERLFTDPLAVFTAILAALTFVLALAGVRAANAAKVAADLVPALERAYIFVEIESHDSGPSSPPKYGVSFKVSNFGKTVAVVKEISARLALQESMAFPEYEREPLDREMVLLGVGDSVVPSPNGRPTFAPNSFTIQRRQVVGKPGTASIYQVIKSGSQFLWLSGKVVYEDVFGREHETPFWFRNEEAGDRVPLRGVRVRGMRDLQRGLAGLSGWHC